MCRGGTDCTVISKRRRILDKDSIINPFAWEILVVNIEHWRVRGTACWVLLFRAILESGLMYPSILAVLWYEVSANWIYIKQMVIQKKKNSRIGVWISISSSFSLIQGLLFVQPADAAYNTFSYHDTCFLVD